jgi:anti-anti-sigma factor
MIDGITILEIQSDRLDLFRTPDLSREVETHLINSGYTSVIFDLRSLTHIDSSGFGFMVSVRNIVHKHGGSAAIVVAGTVIPRIIELMNIQLLFPVFDTIEEAVEHIKMKTLS